MTAETATAAACAEASSEMVVECGTPYDLPRTLGVLQRGYADPAVRVDAGTFSGGPHGTPGAGAWMCQRIYGISPKAPRTLEERPAPLSRNTAESPASDPLELGQVTLRFDQLSASEVRVRVAVRPERIPADLLTETALQRAASILGVEDDWTGLELLLDALGDRASTELARTRRRHPGVRLPATGALFDQVVNVTLEQKVTHEQARHSWRNLLKRHGERPPSSSALSAPEWMRLPLTATQLKRVPSWEWHRMWVQPPLSRTVLRIAERAPAIHRLGKATPSDSPSLAGLAEQLTSVPGIGPWTSAETLQRSHGAADLVAVGDYHLAHFVGEALTGRRTDDAGMLELLKPYRPHRQRVVRLLGLSGFRMSRFGPRLDPEDHRQR
ncbi:DNA-3-methyladenine glycosylase family protein [Nesterenkonia muleiensis]|uniref:DNA-3-methyladenine glycosylase family protein n=1 Tax=Nesterenkonia muleiensis TaxID=2282648 RepID=UPI000E741A8E|nr:3-methyladenine DNA glycosylase [Nesterenkonia muleiensis]